MARTLLLLQDCASDSQGSRKKSKATVLEGLKLQAVPRNHLQGAVKSSAPSIHWEEAVSPANQAVWFSHGRDATCHQEPIRTQRGPVGQQQGALAGAWGRGLVPQVKLVEPLDDCLLLTS